MCNKRGKSLRPHLHQPHLHQPHYPSKISPAPPKKKPPTSFCRSRFQSLRIGNGIGKQGRGNQPPISTIRTPYGNSVSTPEATRTCKTQQNSLQKGSQYGISVSTPHRRYGHRLRDAIFADAIFRDYYREYLDCSHPVDASRCPRDVNRKQVGTSPISDGTRSPTC